MWLLFLLALSPLLLQAAEQPITSRYVYYAVSPTYYFNYSISYSTPGGSQLDLSVVNITYTLGLTSLPSPLPMFALRALGSFQSMLTASNPVTVSSKGAHQTELNYGDFDLRETLVEGLLSEINSPYCSIMPSDLRSYQCYQICCISGVICYCLDQTIDPAACPEVAGSMNLSSASTTSLTSCKSSSISLTSSPATRTAQSSSMTSLPASSTVIPTLPPNISYPDAHPGLKNLTHTPITNNTVAQHVLNQSLIYSKLGGSLRPDDVTILSILVHETSVLPSIEPPVSRVKSYFRYYSVVLVRISNTVDIGIALHSEDANYNNKSIALAVRFYQGYSNFGQFNRHVVAKKD